MVPDTLLTTFDLACRRAGCQAGHALTHAHGGELLARWASAERGYHNTEHLAEVLAALQELVADSPQAVLAAWFHDAVYRGRPGDDERASAALAGQVLTELGCPPAMVKQVTDTVLITIDHRPDPTLPWQTALVDADLAILAAPRPRYRRYLDGIRREYGHVSEQDFRVGRAAVVATLLARDPLFHNGSAQGRWQDAARENLTWELNEQRG